tara:strand:+ start:660 stop:944 length:285 start_codon:yes stop_codon:yes gene_type:complete
MTTPKSKRTKKKVNNNKRPNDNDLVLRFEDAWNYIVSHSPKWKQEIIINMTEEEAKKVGGRTAQVHHETAKEVIFLAQSNRKIPPPKENWQKPE